MSSIWEWSVCLPEVAYNVPISATLLHQVTIPHPQCHHVYYNYYTKDNHPYTGANWTYYCILGTYTRLIDSSCDIPKYVSKSHRNPGMNKEKWISRCKSIYLFCPKSDREIFNFMNGAKFSDESVKGRAYIRFGWK